MPARRWLKVLVVAGAGWMLLGIATDAAARPQSLGDVARRGAERPKDAAKAPGRTYTNENLAAVDSPPAPSQAAPTGSAPAAEEPPAPAATAADKGPTVMEEDPETHKLNIRTTVPAREKRDEQYWRTRAKDVRDRLAKASADLTAAQTSLAALDGGPKTPAATRERSVVAAAVQRLQSEVQYRQQDVAKLQTHAEMNKVPADWIR